jgi:hypothetical protein
MAEVSSAIDVPRTRRGPARLDRHARIALTLGIWYAKFRALGCKIQIERTPA